MEYNKIIVDRPIEFVQRITLNNPEKANALSQDLRREFFHALESADVDDSIRVTIIRGGGKNFSSGYDLYEGVRDLNTIGQPFHTAGNVGMWPRHLVESCIRMWDMCKPIICQVHGACIGGAAELAAGSDLVYIAEDAKIGYPIVRNATPPNVQFFPWIMGMRPSMEMMLTGDSITGADSVEYGFANRAFPVEELDDAVLKMAERVAKVPVDVQQINKRAMHKQMEIMGIRTGIRWGAEIETLARHTESCLKFKEGLMEDVKATYNARDKEFGDDYK